jgi:hypothetical protein
VRKKLSNEFNGLNWLLSILHEKNKTTSYFDGAKIGLVHMLEKLNCLTIRPGGGLCNRLQAIASARRIHALCGCKCVVVWDWGNYWTLFEKASDYSYSSAVEESDYVSLRHRHSSEGGNMSNRIVPNQPNIFLTSQYLFVGEGESPQPIHAYREFLPRPVPMILQLANEFADKNDFTDVVGLHMRRADHKAAQRLSPDRMFIAVSDRIIAEGKRIFLATDNVTTETIMKKRYGRSVIFRKKNPALKVRWPRRFRFMDTVDDLVDLHLLATCGYVIGSSWSSFTKIAIMLNGSTKCDIIHKYDS